MIVATRRDLVGVTGPDAGSFLQGQVSADVEQLAEGDSCWTLVLQPQGKVDAWGRLTRTGTAAFVFDTEAGFGAAALARLDRFRLRVDVDLELTESVPTLAVRDEPAPPVGARLVAPARWPVHDGMDLIDPLGEVVPTADVAELERLRIEAGVPRMGSELGDSVIPAEAGSWLIDVSVDFDKGCYVGQELVARVDSRGSNTPRRVRRLRFGGPVSPPVGAAVRAGGEVVGTVTSAAAGVALASLRRGLDVPADVEVDTAGGPTPASVEGL